jgi:hypothetical protein
MEADGTSFNQIDIESIKDELHSVTEELPLIGSHVLAVEDLSPLGKGVFLSDYWYTKFGFVAELHYDDAYGYITHWAYLRLENE